MHKLLASLLVLLTFSSPPACAGPSQSHAVIRDTVLAFVQTQTRALPGKVSIQVSEIDRRIVLPACPALEAFLPAGTQLNGNSNVGVRCNGKQSWSLFVQVNVKISVNLLTANTTLRQGQTVGAEDIGSLSSESLQAGTMTDPAQAIGKIMKYGVAAGQILRQDMLRAPYTVKQGQTVRIRVQGSGFRVSAEGQSLNNAAEGETALVRTPSGQTASGVVRGGIIEVSQ
ncbi:MAG TPA: flagellar basal body P-ring formation chaperone FlgA [Gallionellaceae bacterium]|nr:flagellar basal body P-ring formation chaperone FlgA [Gallionellaceae bacterium]